jgi:cell division protein FtsL
MRFIHLIVVAALVAAAVDVYKIKFESTVQAERVAKLRVEIRREHDVIAALRAEWAQLDNPARIQALAQRHLPLKPMDPLQIEPFDHLPERPPPQDDGVAKASNDSEQPTGSVNAAASNRAAPAPPPPAASSTTATDSR